MAGNSPGARSGAGLRGSPRSSLPSLAWLWLALVPLLSLAINPATASAAPVVVVAHDPDAPLSQRRLLDALGGQLSELGVEVMLSPDPALGTAGGDAAAADRDVLAFVWIEQQPDALVVHFYEPAGASLRERRIPVTGTDAASLEEVAIVVRSAASALLERVRTTGATAPSPSALPTAPATAPPTTSAPPPRPPPPSASASGPLQLSLGYAGSRYSADLPWAQGARAALGWRPARSRWRLGLAYTWLPTTERSADAATVSLERRPVELFVGHSLPLGSSSWHLQPEGAIGADPVRRRTLGVGEALEPTPATTRWSWYATSRLALAWEPASRISLFAAGGADFLLNRFEQVVESEVLVAPLRLRPRVELGLSLTWPRRSPPVLPDGAH